MKKVYSTILLVAILIGLGLSWFLAPKANAGLWVVAGGGNCGDCFSIPTCHNGIAYCVVRKDQCTEVCAIAAVGTCNDDGSVSGID